MALGHVGSEFLRALGIESAKERVGAPLGVDPWVSRLPVGILAADSVAVASLTLDVLASERFGREVAQAVTVDRAKIAASFGSERVLRIDGEAPRVWAPLSGFWMTADGWVRTHGNYLHHGRALRALLDVGEDAGKPEIATVLRGWSAVELEESAAQFGAVVGKVRTADEWQQHPHGRVVSASPLIEFSRIGGADQRRWVRGRTPLAGIRVLDLTRVIAGPVAARDLAFAGADVLRVDSPSLEETGWIHLDTAQGKRSTLLNLRARADWELFELLLARADVVLTGYRPGALARFGIDPASLAERHPGLVTASVSAWGFSGRWSDRRGFDSIVQAASGIALVESADGVTPGALPVQALDHSTGHFLAAAIVVALAEQRRTGASIDVRMSLARTAHALLTSPDPVTETQGSAVPLPFHERQLAGRHGMSSLTYAPPVLAFAGAAADYQQVGGAWGADAAEWLS